MKSLEMNLINRPQDQLRGSATWLAKALKVEEAQIMLAIDACQANTSGMENQQCPLQGDRTGYNHSWMDWLYQLPGFWAKTAKMKC